MSVPQTTRPDRTEEFQLVGGQDARQKPVRLVVVQADKRPAVDVTDEPVVMTFPHLMIRESIAFLAFSIVLFVISLFFNAPLEELANPEKTPNPAKAPWYFLGLQELLHYYPPLVSGVIIPGLVMMALAVIPYFEVNLQRRPLCEGNQRRNMTMVWTAIAVLTALLMVSGAHPVWPAIGPLWAVGLLMSIPPVFPRSEWVTRWLWRRSLAFWIFTWFLLTAATMTAIGVFFRGPGWSFVLPWRDGLFY